MKPRCRVARLVDRLTGADEIAARARELRVELSGSLIEARRRAEMAEYEARQLDVQLGHAHLREDALRADVEALTEALRDADADVEEIVHLRASLEEARDERDTSRAAKDYWMARASTWKGCDK